MNDPGEVGRRHPARLPLFEKDNLAQIVFVTVCTKERKRVLSSADAVAAILAGWREADHWLVGRYVVMPEHIHLFCAPARLDTLPLKRWVAFWKSRASGRWPRREEHPLWQQDCWDTQLRRSESYSQKWEYVRNNPVRHGYVAQPEEWRYQGELNVLQWHDP